MGDEESGIKGTSQARDIRFVVLVLRSLYIGLPMLANRLSTPVITMMQETFA